MKATSIAANILLAGLLFFSGCGKRQTGPVKRSWGKMNGLEGIVGNLSDTSYSLSDPQKSRINALGKPVQMGDFRGRFVWSEYAAPWCSPCKWQALEMRKVQKEKGETITFLTIMTSASQKYADHATMETARQWASAYNLDPSQVLAAELWSKTIPEHRFFSPEGHTLFVHVGTLSAEQINQVIAFYKPVWERWKETGEKADWMTE